MDNANAPETEPPISMLPRCKKVEAFRRFWKGVFICEVALLIILYFVVPFFQQTLAPKDLILLFGYLSTLACLTCLLSAYAGLGNWQFRWAPFVLGLPVLAWSSGTLVGQPGVEWYVFVGSMAFVVAGTTASLRFWKGRLAIVHPGELSLDGLQFGIKDLLIWTTLAAVLIGPTRWLVNNFQSFGGGGGDELASIGAMSICLATMIVFNTWALLGQRITTSKCIALLMVTLICSFLCGWLLEAEFGFVGLVAQIEFLLMLIPLRLSGLRFVKPV